MGSEVSSFIFEPIYPPAICRGYAAQVQIGDALPLLLKCERGAVVDHEGVIEPRHLAVVGGAVSAAGGARWGELVIAAPDRASSMRMLVQVDPRSAERGCHTATVSLLLF